MNREVHGPGLNKQQRTADKVRSSSWEVRRRANSAYKINNLRNVMQGLRVAQFLWNKLKNMDIARMGVKRNTCTVLVGRPQERPLKRPGRTGRIISKWIHPGSGLGQATASCEYGNEISGSIILGSS